MKHELTLIGGGNAHYYEGSCLCGKWNVKHKRDHMIRVSYEYHVDEAANEFIENR